MACVSFCLYSNYHDGHILYCFGDKARYWWKITISVFIPSSLGNRYEYVRAYFTDLWPIRWCKYTVGQKIAPFYFLQ